MKRKTTKRNLIPLILAAFLCLASLSACGTEQDTSNQASVEISLNSGTYILDSRIALSQDLQSYREENGSSAAVKVDIQPYSVYDLSPSLDGTRHNGLTYQEQKEKLDNAAILAKLWELQYEADPTEENAEKLRDAQEAVAEEQAEFDAFSQAQSDQKLKSVVDHLNAKGIPTEISYGGITATLNRDELMTLAETSCIFFTVSMSGLDEF